MSRRMSKLETLSFMVQRLSKLEYGCYLALVAKSRSEDPHTQVGAVAFSKDFRVLGTAYNGLRAGKEVPNWMYDDSNRLEKADLMIHAESNLCSLLTKDICHTICLTHSPCIKCCQNIAALNIKQVVYLKEYKDSKFKDFFEFHGISYLELPQEGKVNIRRVIQNMLVEDFGLDNAESLVYH